LNASTARKAFASHSAARPAPREAGFSAPQLFGMPNLSRDLASTAKWGLLVIDN
jgi:hypothetical protein